MATSNHSPWSWNSADITTKCLGFWTSVLLTQCYLTFISTFLLLVMLTSLLKLQLCIHLRFMSLDRSKPGIIQNLQIAHQDCIKSRWYQCLLSSKLRTCSQRAEFNSDYISFRKRIFFWPPFTRAVPDCQFQVAVLLATT